MNSRTVEPEYRQEQPATSAKRDSQVIVQIGGKGSAISRVGESLGPQSSINTKLSSRIDKDRNVSIDFRKQSTLYKESGHDMSHDSPIVQSRYRANRSEIDKHISSPPRPDRFRASQEYPVLLKSGLKNAEQKNSVKLSNFENRIPLTELSQGRAGKADTVHTFETIHEIVKQKPQLKSDNSAVDEDVQMTAEEEKVYGKRFIQGYEKIKLIGKGGQAMVWLARRKIDSALFAVKQIVIGGFVSEKTAKKEIDFNEVLFGEDQESDSLVNIGKRSIIRIVEHSSTPKDLFMVLELCGAPLSKLVYSMKGEFLKSERIYKVGLA